MLFKNKKHKDKICEINIDYLEKVLFDICFECKKMLGNDYHMCITYNGTIFPEYILFRNFIEDHEKYYSETNKFILSSKAGNTIEDLVLFTRNYLLKKQK